MSRAWNVRCKLKLKNEAGSKAKRVLSATAQRWRESLADMGSCSRQRRKRLDGNREGSGVRWAKLGYTGLGIAAPP